MKRLVLSAAAVAAIGVMAVPALAGGQADTRVTIARNNPFHGQVLPASHKDACNDRTVKILIQQPSANKPVDKTHTDADGRYAVEVSVHKSTYYAVATRKVLADGFICRRGQSHPINFQ
jgi:predicted RNase H-like nuclease